ncbi:MAG: DUF3108 domain-containing protein [Pseudomonadota bacterium]
MSRPAGSKSIWVAAMALVAVVLATNARAAERMIFDIYVLGIRAGELEIASATNQSRYALAGRLESTGLLGAIRRVRYGGEAKGRITRGQLAPDLYSDTTVSDDRRSGGRMAYRNAVPQPKTYTPPRTPDPEDVDPATQRGSIDPLTAMYTALRDRPRDLACRTDARLFDGRRATRLRIVPVPGDPLRCRGVYVRIAGYDADELAERREFPFEMRLEATEGDAVRVAEITARTIYGRARLVQR